MSRAFTDSTPAAGRVDLVGAGPGDPGLLTLDAAAALRDAEVLLHDRLIPEAILAMASPQAERCYVGKARSNHSLRQEELNALMIERAREGRYVVRLKGGDPYVFGRGGEEAAALAAAGIPVRVIPGISAAGGCAAFAGIPLTHRDHAHRCQFVTAHRRNGSTELDWEALAAPRQTVVIYMGLNPLAEICAGLVAAGAPATRPAAIIEHGTRPGQRVVAGTLGDLPGRTAALALESPSLLIVGDVVGERARLTGDAAGAPAMDLGAVDGIHG